MLGTKPVHAAPRPVDVEPVRIIYRADAGCPTEESFVEGLFLRTARARAATTGEPARTFTVTVSSGAGGGSGVLETVGLDGAATRREVTGHECSEVVSALALIAALTIDPRASTRERPTSTDDQTDAIPSRGAVLSLPAPVAVTPTATDASPRAAATRPSRGIGSTVNWTLGLEGQAFAGLVPAFAGGGGGFADLSPVDPRIPAFRISLFIAATGTPPESRVGAQISWFLNRLQVCPARLALKASFGLNGCLALDAGVIRVGGVGLDHPSTELKPWFAPGALGRLMWLLPSGLEIEAGGGVTLPLHRYPFRYDPGNGAPAKQLYRPSFLGGTLTLGVAYRFP